jgi:zinc transporter
MRGWQLDRLADGTVHEVALGDATDPDAFDWIHIDGRDPAAADWLAHRSGVSAPVLAALTAAETRPRTEQFSDGALINLRGLGATPEDDPDPLVSIRLWATHGRVISVSYRTLNGLDELAGAMREGRLRDPGDVIAGLAVRISERLDPQFAELGDRLDDCETAIDPRRAFTMRRKIGRIRSKAIGYRRFVATQWQALERLAAIECAWLADNDRLHLREAADRFARMTEELEWIRERSALMHEQLTDLRAEQIETRTLVLSIVALVFLPLTFLTGLLGMNVEGIPYAREPWAFWGVVGLCAIVAIAIASYFIRARWFR